MPFRAALFDFDGTLADSFDAIIASVNHTRGEFRLPPLPGGTVRKFIGHGLVQLLHDLCPDCPSDRAVKAYRDHHAATMVAGTRLFAGVAETLTELTRRGVKLAVCSNKAVAFTKELVKGLGMEETFAAVLGPEDVDGKPKPDPAMLLHGCRLLGVTPLETVYVGDMDVDVLAGHAAGMQVWLVPDHLDAGGRSLQPDRTLATFAAILEGM